MEAFVNCQLLAQRQIFEREVTRIFAQKCPDECREGFNHGGSVLWSSRRSQFFAATWNFGEGQALGTRRGLGYSH